MSEGAEAETLKRPNVHRKWGCRRKGCWLSTKQMQASSSAKDIPEYVAVVHIRVKGVTV